MSSGSDGARVVVVGASGGIGSAIVSEFLSRGAAVIGVDLRDWAAPENHERYDHIKIDFSNENSVATFVRIAQRIDVRHVINVAGGALPEEVNVNNPLEFAHAIADETQRHNFTTSLNSIALAVYYARDRRSAADTSVTLCSSINAIGNFGYPLYSASKSATESLIHSLARPLGQQGVRINCLRLGTVVTRTSLDLHGDADNLHYENLRRLSALGRFVDVAEVAILAHSISIISSMTGTVLTLDAGQSVPGQYCGG